MSGSTGLPAIAGTYEATLSYIATPTELIGWLDHVVIPLYHTAWHHIIATLTSAMVSLESYGPLAQLARARH